MAANGIEKIIEALRSTAGCTVLPPSTLPEVRPYFLPEDVRRFYELCGGIHLYDRADYGIEIVSPDRFVKSNPLIAGVEGKGDISYDWFIVAQSGEQYISIDLGSARSGRCYDSFWDRHAVAGSCPIIALTFSELLANLVNARGQYWFWLQSGFMGHGDAYAVSS